MPSAISGVSTAELIAEGASPACDPDSRYEADWELIKRCRAGIDLPLLVALMQSESSAARSRAAFLIEEAATAHEALYEAIVGFADDNLADRRRAFVKSVTDAHLYDARIADALAKCLHDRDLTVRLCSIRWAIDAPTGSFDHFCTLVGTGAGLRLPTPRPSNRRWLDIWRAESLQRADRALAIARRVRSGESIRDIRTAIAEEDSFVLCGLEHFLQLRQERRRIPSARQSPATG